ADRSDHRKTVSRVFNAVEDLARVSRQLKILVESQGTAVTGIGSPFDAATTMLAREVEQRVHEQLANAMSPVLLGDVQLFQVQRPRQSDRRPQERPRREPGQSMVIASEQRVSGGRSAKQGLADLTDLVVER